MYKNENHMTVDSRYSTYNTPIIYPGESGANWIDRTSTDGDRRKGQIIVLGLLSVLLVMSSLISMDSAAISRGTVQVDGSNKSVQHLEGGIVSEILVKEGDIVKKGDPLVLLNDLQVSKKYENLQQQMILAYAQKSRWQTVQSGSKSIEFTQWLQQQDSAEVESIMAQQSRLFKSNLELFNTENAVLRGKHEKSEQRKNNESQRYVRHGTAKARFGIAFG